MTRTFAPKSSHVQIFLNLPRRKVMIYFCQKGKKWRVTDFVVERTCPENTLNLKNRASLVNTASLSISAKILQLVIRNVLCQILSGPFNPLMPNSDLIDQFYSV